MKELGPFTCQFGLHAFLVHTKTMYNCCEPGQSISLGNQWAGQMVGPTCWLHVYTHSRAIQLAVTCFNKQ
jgi:hypothetical protein